VRFIGAAVLLELAIAIATGIDTWRRPPAMRRPWAVVWFWWHLAPAWLLWRALVSSLMAAAVRAARASYERHALRHTDGAPLLAADDRWPHDNAESRQRS
jgi:hypothetical protein